MFAHFGRIGMIFFLLFAEYFIYLAWILSGVRSTQCKCTLFDELFQLDENYIENQSECADFETVLRIRRLVP